MPINRFLEDQAFEPELVSVMGDAFVELCRQLGLKYGADDAATRRVASAVIQAARDGNIELSELVATAGAKLGLRTPKKPAA